MVDPGGDFSSTRARDVAVDVMMAKKGDARAGFAGAEGKRAFGGV